MNVMDAIPFARANVPAAGEVVIDHLAHWVPDEPAASARLEALGFTLAPFSHQVTRATPDAPPVSAGTANRCMMFRQGYIEILTTTGDTPNAQTLKKGMARYVGVHLIAFGSPDGDATADQLRAAGFAPLPTVRLEREIGLQDGGTGHVRFNVVRLPPEAMPEGRIQFCHHRTPENMWQGRWLDHPNGATGLTSILVASPDPAETASRIGRFVGRAATRRADGAMVLALDRGALVIVAGSALPALTGAATPSLPYIAGYGVSVADIAATRALAKDGRAVGDAHLVDAGPAVGGTIAFVPRAGAEPWLA
ncbi:MAG: VOC family protein [Alphaproteobacteria bacterium]